MLPEKQPDKAIGQRFLNPEEEGTIFSLEHYEGLIPHPRMMKEWEEIVPGSAKSIFTRFENQSDHRIESEKKVIRANNFKQYVGPVFAFIIAMSAIGGGIWIAVKVQPLVGGLLSLSGLAAVITPFLVNEIRGKERSDGKK